MSDPSRESLHAGDATPEPATPLVEVRDLGVAFGRHHRQVLHGVSFTIAAGQRVGLIGESGSGKTVTALALMGLLAPNATATGSIRLATSGPEGYVDAVTAGERRLSQLRGDDYSMIFQEPMTALDPTMKAGRQIAELVGLHGRGGRGSQGQRAGEDGASTRERVLEMLRRVDLADAERIADSYPHQLSGGQRQRVLAAMALINDPRLVVCDEPTTALDVSAQATVLRVLDRHLASRGAATLFITHDLAVLSQVCEHVMVMLDGHVVESGPLREVLRDPWHPYTRGLVATARLDRIEPGTRLPTVSDFFDRARDPVHGLPGLAPEDQHLGWVHRAAVEGRERGSGHG